MQFQLIMIYHYIYHYNDKGNDLPDDHFHLLRCPLSMAIAGCAPDDYNDDHNHGDYHDDDVDVEHRDYLWWDLPINAGVLPCHSGESH